MGGGQKLNRLRRKIGAVLIEFAFAIPVFLVLIYYIHDLPKQKLMQRKMQFVANEMAAILQNIAAQRQSNGQFLMREDTHKTLRLASLSIFPGMTQYPTNSSYTSMPLGYIPVMQIYYVVGLSGGKATVRWRCRTHALGQNFQSINNQGGFYSMANINGTTPSEIYPALKLTEGETKVIVEYVLWNRAEINFSATGISTGKISKAKLFGFLLFKPKPVVGFGAESKNTDYFPAVTIFTPQGGFSEVPPQ